MVEPSTPAVGGGRAARGFRVTTGGFYGLLLMIAGTAVVMVLLATRHGVGLGNDSTTYITEARQLLRGHGLSTAMGAPVTHFPPLFPLLIAAPGLAGVDVMTAARWLNLALLAANVMLIGVIVYHSAGRSKFA